MGWKKIGEGLAKIAPVAARVATSGILGGGVADAITQAVGLAKGSSEDDVEEALAKASPSEYAQMRVKLAEIEAETDRQERSMRYKTRELDTREAKIEADDRASARQRQMAVRDKTPEILAYGQCISLVVVIVLVFMRAESLQDKVYIVGLLGTIVGGLLNGIGQILSYYFGSSRGSSRKDDTIHHVMAATGASQPQAAPRGRT